MSEEIAHEAVVSSLLDLQARLRGDGDVEAPVEPTEALPEAVDASSTQAQHDALPVESLSVIEADLSVTTSPEDEDELLRIFGDEEPDGYAPPAVALQVAEESSEEARLASLAERLGALETELDAVLERIDTADSERLDRLEALHEVSGAHAAESAPRSESHFTDLQHAIEDRMRDTTE